MHVVIEIYHIITHIHNINNEAKDSDLLVDIQGQSRILLFSLKGDLERWDLYHYSEE